MSEINGLNWKCQSTKEWNLYSHLRVKMDGLVFQLVLKSTLRQMAQIASFKNQITVFSSVNAKKKAFNAI